MTTSFSLAALYQQYFGTAPATFHPKFNVLPHKVHTSSKGAQYYDYDALGREYFLPAVISYTLTTYTGKGTDSFSEGKKYTLPYPLITVTGKKTIVETALTERAGTVKEIINVQDYEIVIKGLIINSSNQFPEADVATLIEIFDLSAPVQLQNALTDILLLQRGGGDNVVVKELLFPEVKGLKNIKPYQLTLISDAIFNLEEIA